MRHFSDELLVGVRFLATQLVIEMNDRQDNPQRATQFQKQPQQSNGVDPTRDGNANPIASFQQFVAPNMGMNALGKGMHGNMVQRFGLRPKDSRGGCP